jgi:hypothetical protein
MNMELFKTAEKIFSSRPLTKRIQHLLAHQQIHTQKDLLVDEEVILKTASDLFKRKKFVEAAKTYRCQFHQHFSISFFTLIFSILVI